MVIDDDDVSIHRALSHAREKARFEVRAFLPETSIRMRIDVPPKRKILRQVRKLGAIARFSLRNPAKNFIKLIDLIHPFENRRTVGALDAMQTRVVVAALHHCRPKLRRQYLMKKGNVFIDQLLL